MERLNFNRKAVCDFCGFEAKVSCCHYGTTNYTRLICLDCAIRINDRHKVLFSERIFNFDVDILETQVKKEVKYSLKKLKEISKAIKELINRNMMIKKQIITIEKSDAKGTIPDIYDEYWLKTLNDWKKSLAFNLELIKKYQDLYFKEMEKD